MNEYIPQQLYPILCVVVFIVIGVVGTVVYKTPSAHPRLRSEEGTVVDVSGDSIVTPVTDAVSDKTLPNTEELFAPATGNTYERHGATIACYQDEGKRRVWEMTFLNENFAIMLMRDLRGE